VFALAPQPLLMLLGHLLGDLQPADVFQLHREPASWAWLSEGEVQPLVVRRPDEHSGLPALVLSLSGTITVDRVTAVLGPNACIWTVTIACPNNDYLKRPEQLQEFRETARKLLDQIKAAHGQGVVLHVFPAAPVAICVELGRALMPKVDLPLRVYDAHKRRGDFAHALDLNTDGGGSR
ncbi:MAG: SAVED domain-containing protein, partial [Phycisphaerales bacterium]